MSVISFYISILPTFPAPCTPAAHFPMSDRLNRDYFLCFTPAVTSKGTVMNPLLVPFARRALKRVDEAGPGEHEFTVVTYNILADYWLQMKSQEGKAYSYCPNDYKISKQRRNAPRHTLFMEELRWLNGDIICLQEVDTPYFEDILADEMSRMGYKGLFAPKCMPGQPEGVALFFKRDKYFKLGTTHITWGDLQQTVTQVCQITFVTNALAEMVTSYESRGEHVSHILCGDFNIEPQFPAYQLVKEGGLNEKEMRALKGVDYIRWGANPEPPSQLLPDQMSLLNKTKTHLHHSLKNLQSTYKTVLGAEPQLTNHEGPGCVWTLDYIWFDAANLKATAALETVPKEAIEPYKGLPNQFFPSDHLSLKGHFKFAVPLHGL